MRALAPQVGLAPAVTAWETIVAAVGGLLLGLGLGLSIGRRNAAGVVAARDADDARIRHAVLPVLEQRISELGIEQTLALDPRADPVGAAVSLATAIRRSDHGRAMAFSDTVEMDAHEKSTRTISQRPGSR